MLGLQRTAGNAAVMALLGAQAKLVVGAADDPYEREADLIARQVMDRLATADTPTPEEAGPFAVTRRSTAGGGSEGGEAGAEIEDAIGRSRRGGQPLDPGTRTRMEGAFGADFSNVQVHSGGEADVLSRSLQARAFTLGSDIWFRGGEYQPTTAPGQELLAHELTHVAQQSTTSVARKFGVIQRHASWEHRMLSDVTPDALKVVVQARDEARAAKEPAKEPDSADEDADYGVVLDVDGGSPIDQAIHVLTTEIENLQAMRADATLSNRAEADAKARAKAGLALAPEVTLVPVTLLDKTWDVVTYGELNTLADYYGSHEEIAKTVPANFRAIVKGLRERELRGFAQLLAEVQGQTAEEIADAKSDDAHEFEGAIGDSGRYSSDRAELQLMGKLSGSMAKSTLPDDPASAYTGGLARNACHFAPYSWHAWAEHHNKAVALAKAAYAKRQEALGSWDPFGDAAAQAAAKAQEVALNAQADELERQAMVINGFGDHFLQDSFASGHLINKTLIMKWFTIYLDQHPLDQDFALDRTWRAVQATAYGQEGVFGEELYDADVSVKSTDPQTAENTPGDWRARFDSLGLSIPKSLRNPRSLAAELFKAWQTAAATKGAKTMSLKQLETLSGIMDQTLQDTVLELVQDGVIHREKGHRSLVPDADLAADMSQIGKAQDLAEGNYHDKDTFTLRANYVPPKPVAPKGAPKGTEPPAAVPATQAVYDDKLKSAAHKDYLTFLNRSYLQFSTNVLHNKFCEEGLTIKSGADGALFKVYGDNAMLEKGAAEGVAYSAETARRSLGAIKAWASEGKVTPERTVNAIAARFPSHVQLPDGKEVTIKGWHEEGGPLQKLCTDVVFPGITKTKNFKSSVVGSGATVAPVVSKDVGSHGSEGF